jgi:hypothetical protein
LELSWCMLMEDPKSISTHRMSDIVSKFT